MTTGRSPDAPREFDLGSAADFAVAKTGELPDTSDFMDKIIGGVMQFGSSMLDALISPPDSYGEPPADSGTTYHSG